MITLCDVGIHSYKEIMCTTESKDFPGCKNTDFTGFRVCMKMMNRSTT